MTCSSAFGKRTEFTIDSHNAKSIADDYTARFDVPDDGGPATCRSWPDPVRRPVR